jgi:hypothetical protein|tara:strand:- start:837 stop:1961 length:1125 start_codon:yes stop_codon:yes gene_type:complete
MGCKTRWNREFIDSFCTKVFRNTHYKNHRETVLFEREKQLMPQTQPEVERILQMRSLRHILTRQKKTLIELHHTHNINYDTLTIHPEVLILYREMEKTYQHLNQIRSQVTSSEFGTRHFTRQCPSEECKGFLNEDWYCGLCCTNYCKHCNEPESDDHVCDSEIVKTMQLLNKDSKSCPKCGTVIHKSSGCMQMWCVNCHTAFNWRTGEIDTGRVHNPHFIEFKKKLISSREHGDIPCGGVPTFRELRENHASNEMLQCMMLVNQLERELLFLNIEPIDNIPTRICYMLNDISEENFKIFLQRQEKFLDKSKEVYHIFELISHTCGDLLRQYIIEPDKHDDILKQMEFILEYSNDIFQIIRSRYNSSTPRHIDVL